MILSARLLRLSLLSASLLICGCFPTGSDPAEEEKETHFLAGKSRVNEMDYKGAINAFEKALEVNPKSGAAHFELGWIFDQKEPEPATAIYHYSHYLELRPRAGNADTVRTRIMACKTELARTVSLGPVTQSLQREFDKLTDENKNLKEELEKCKSYSASLQALTNHPAPTPLVNIPNRGSNNSTAVLAERHSTGSNPGLSSPPRPSISSNSPGPALGRTHTVKAGETPSTIAKKYGVKLDALLAANPRLDARRMQVNQTLSIPASSASP
jgi:LysM repeat protein